MGNNEELKDLNNEEDLSVCHPKVGSKQTIAVVSHVGCR